MQTNTKQPTFYTLLDVHGPQQHTVTGIFLAGFTAQRFTTTHDEDVTVLGQDGGGVVLPSNLGLGTGLGEALAVGLVRLVDLQPAYKAIGTKSALVATLATQVGVLAASACAMPSLDECPA